MTMEKNAAGEKPRPKVGVGILIQNDKNEVLLGLRNVSHGTGEWSFPPDLPEVLHRCRRGRTGSGCPAKRAYTKMAPKWVLFCIYFWR